MAELTAKSRPLVEAAIEGGDEAMAALVAALDDPAAHKAALSALLAAPKSRLWTHLLEYAARDATRAQQDDRALTHAANAIGSAFAAGDKHASGAARRRALLDGSLHPNPGIRAYTASLLGRRGDEAAAKALQRLLSDSDDHVRAAAVRALMDFEPGAEEIAQLVSLLNRFDIVAAEAVRALEHAGPAAVPALIAELGSHAVWTRVHSVRALAGIGDVRAIDPLIGLLDDADASVRWEAATALGRLGPAVLDPLLHVLAVREPTIWFAECAARVLRRAAQGERYALVATLDHLLRQAPVPLEVPIAAISARARLARLRLSENHDART